MPALGWRVLVVCGLLLSASSSFGQSSAAHSLLRLVPHDDFGVCVLVPDLAKNSKQLLEAPWFARLQSSPWSDGLLRNNPQWTHIESELKKHLHIDWSELRDDILGDALVLAYRPPGKGEPEQGLLLLHARDPSRLAQLVERINQGQKKAGDLKELLAVSHQGKQYFHRVEKGKNNFYYIDGGLLAFSGTEAWIRAVIERSQSAHATVLVEQFRRSEADKAVAAIWLNPRFVENEFKQKASSATAEGLLARALGPTWRTLEGIFVSAHLGDSVEFRVSLQAKSKDLPPETAKLFAEAAKPSDLWRQFPSDAIVAVAGRIDVPTLAAAADSMLPEMARAGLADAWKRALAAAAGLDFARDVLPNIGPDWGFACWPAPNADPWPHCAAAFAVRPGTTSVAVDKSLLKAVHFLATFVVVDYNLKHSGSLRLDSIAQDGVQIHYLDDPKLFPPGIRPAMALKNGYLVLAGNPEAIRRFGTDPTSRFPANETPLLRISIAGVRTLMDSRREHLISHVAERSGMPAAKARDWLSQISSGLELFQRLQLLHRAGDGQSTWILRLDPTK